MEIDKRNYTLDVLRILAALMVLAVHVGQITGLNNETNIGQKGVYLFFILSGYLGMTSCERILYKGAPRDYWLNRVKRILPQYYFILVVEYIYSIFLYHAQGINYQQIFDPVHGVCGLQYLRYFFFLQYVLPSKNFSLWNNRFALWTMSSFAFFYLLAPWAYKAINSKGKAFVMIRYNKLRKFE